MNTTFKAKYPELQAFQMTRERRVSNTDWPNWLHEACRVGKVRPAYPLSDGMERLVVDTLYGPRVADWNDYIIVDPAGDFYVATQAYFEAKYVSVAPRILPGQVKQAAPQSEDFAVSEAHQVADTNTGTAELPLEEVSFSWANVLGPAGVQAMANMREVQRQALEQQVKDYVVRVELLTAEPHTDLQKQVNRLQYVLETFITWSQLGDRGVKQLLEMLDKNSPVDEKPLNS